MALQVSPRYTKALLKRVKCYEALNRVDLAMRDVRVVLNLEPNNSMALEVLDSLRMTMEEKGIFVDETEIALAALQHHPDTASARLRKIVREKIKNKKEHTGGEDEGKAKKVIIEEKVKVENVEKKDNYKDKDHKFHKDHKDKEKKVVKKVKENEKLGEKDKEKGVVTRTVKLIHGEDIRWAQLPVNCGMRLVRDVIRDRFPGLKGVLVKYRDREGDLVTITNIAELRLAETCHVLGSIRLYVTEIEPDQELHGLFRDVSSDEADDQAARMRLQIYLLWGTLLYERSVVEYKLGLPTWEECLEVAVEKFELAGASTTDIGVMIKNHCSNETTMEGFKIDEIVQALNEMYDGWQFDVPSIRLEPLFRRRVPTLHYILEQF
ncbi:hypothetical protein glysoja_041590 [Glycine soja]|uniref:PB1 domain-containing protein n=1 Tax=Glycine soja TaxID=3848 RepID=A0A0B2SW84_GLYSO|nr:hypothetical protein glysoja_041590 [Glycine soja]